MSSALHPILAQRLYGPPVNAATPVLFNSYTFLFAFLPLCWLGFRLLSRFGGDVLLGWLIGCSLVFYAWWNPTYLPLLLGSIGFNYLWGALVARTGRGVAIGVLANLGLLGMFKYASLVVSTVQPVWSLTDPEFVLPLAISFFTFQQVAYIVQCARTRKSNPRFLEYMLFVCFFPQLIAGPIVGHDPFVAQLRTPDWFRVPATLSGPGLTLLVLGLFKKLVIADSFAPWANDLFSDPTVTPDLVTAWRGTLAYTLQIYFDFSGYSDMALGLGRLFGIRLPENFDAPYRATSIVDFWRRWHITLSVFLRDYLYIPLGGNRHGPVRRWANLFITMLLGGLWHGASWTFMGWGAMHGAMLAFTHMWWSVVGRDRVPRPIAILATCTAVAFAWVLFRAEDIPRSMEIWRAMVGLGELGTPRSTDLALVLGMLLCWVAPVSWRWVDSKPNGLRLLPSIGIGLAAVCALVFLKRVTPFLYFQF